MTHWGWYWRVKKKYKPKKTCFAQDSIDSFEMFKNKEGVAWVKSTQARVVFEVFRYNLVARFLDDDSLAISSNAGPQLIRVERMSCNELLKKTLANTAISGKQFFKVVAI